MAHLALSFKDPAIMLGNFIADDISRKEEQLLPEPILVGVQLHRLIDEVTDDHAAFKAANQKLRPYHRKYAPVVLDILNDHLLSKTWNTIYDEKESTFHQFVYHSFISIVGDLPPKASLHVQSLLKYQYLRAYGSRDGLKDVLNRMDRRTKFPSDFGAAVDQLYENYNFYEDQFLVLFKDIQQEISSYDPGNKRR